MVPEGEKLNVVQKDIVSERVNGKFYEIKCYR